MCAPTGAPAAVERVTGHKLEGRAAGGVIDLRNSGSTTLDGTFAAVKDGENVIKHWWELTDEDVSAMLEATEFHPANVSYFPWRRPSRPTSAPQEECP